MILFLLRYYSSDGKWLTTDSWWVECTDGLYYVYLDGWCKRDVLWFVNYGEFLNNWKFEAD